MIKRKKKVGLASILIFLLAVTGLAQSASDPINKGKTGEAEMIITGRVVSPYGPESGARVRIPGEDEFTLTDKDGRYRLKAAAPPGNRTLRVTAGKEGFFNNRATVKRDGRAGDIFLNPIYLNDRSDYKFNSPRVCYACHTKLALTWLDSKMAHATSNPKLLDMYYGTDAYGHPGRGPGYRLDNPDSVGNCAICHAPSAAADPGRSLDLKDILSSSRTEWDGISCEYCHKVRKVIDDPSTPSGAAAILERQKPASGQSILVFGPYDDVVVPPMAASYNPIYESGRFCSLCHSHREPLAEGKVWDREKIYTDEEWSGFGLKDDTMLPIQTTYQEWKAWQDGLPQGDPNKEKNCQQCHMSWTKKLLPYENYVVENMARNMWGTFRDPKNIRPHHFEGGTRAQLANALAMELEGRVEDGLLTIKVHISNTNGGHWVPTGEPMRSVMLLVEARDSDEKPLKLVRGGRLPEWTGSGKPDDGGYAGLPGAVFAKVLADKDGNLNVPFWRAASIAMDTRIRPKKTRTIEFVFELPDPDDEPAVEARLIYRPVNRSLAEQKKWKVDDIPMVSKSW
ncbi:MAG: multiheme c-type cytochrome [Candidatus Adiutricales bacterium]